MLNNLRRLAAIACSLFAGAVAAQAYPTKPITMIVPFTAGGPTDTVARSLGQAMGKTSRADRGYGKRGRRRRHGRRNARQERGARRIHNLVASHRHVDRACAVSQARIQPANRF